MLLSFDLVGEILDELAEAFPPEFYQDLNGGISLLPECKEDPEALRGAVCSGRVLQRSDGAVYQPLLRLLRRPGPAGELAAGGLGGGALQHAGP